MSMLQKFWSETLPIADRCLQHPFVQGLADGSLAKSKFMGFIAQDAFFLDVFARAYGAGIARAPDLEGRRAFFELAGGVFEELKLHASVAEELGLQLSQVVPLKATRSYTDFLLANAFSGTLGELVASMAPCMKLYHFLGAALAQDSNSSAKYADWIETYSGPEFANLVTRVEGLMDRYCEGSAEEMALFERAINLEYEFFDEAWQLNVGK